LCSLHGIPVVIQVLSNLFIFFFPFQIHGVMSFQLWSHIGIWLLLVTSYYVRSYFLSDNHLLCVSLMCSNAPLLPVDVKQYPKLIKTLCFLLNPYKPKDKTAVAGSSRLHRNVTISGNVIQRLLQT